MYLLTKSKTNDNVSVICTGNDDIHVAILHPHPAKVSIGTQNLANIHCETTPDKPSTLPSLSLGTPTFDSHSKQKLLRVVCFFFPTSPTFLKRKLSNLPFIQTLGL